MHIYTTFKGYLKDELGNVGMFFQGPDPTKPNF